MRVSRTTDENDKINFQERKREKEKKTKKKEREREREREREFLLSYRLCKLSLV